MHDFGRLGPLYLSVFVAVLGFSLVAPIFPHYAMSLGASYTLLGIIVSIYGAVLADQPDSHRAAFRSAGKKEYPAARTSQLHLHAASLHLRHGCLCAPLHQGFGPLIGGALYDSFGMSAPFYFWALLGAISFIIVYFRVQEPVKKEVSLGGEPQKTKARLINPGFQLTFFACCSVVLWAGIVGGFNYTMLPGYASRLGFSATDVGLIYLAYGGSTALSNIYFGRQADRGRRKLLIFAGCLAGAVSFAALFVAASLPQVVILFAGIGTGLGMGSPAAAALIADTTCGSRRGEIYGIFNTSRMSGVVVGPLVAGLTADAYGVSGAVTAFVAIAVGVTLLSLLVREPARECIDENATEM